MKQEILSNLSMMNFHPGWMFFHAVIVLCMLSLCSRHQEAPRAQPAPPRPPLGRWGSGSRGSTSGTWSSAWSRNAPQPARCCSTRLYSSRTWFRLELRLRFVSSLPRVCALVRLCARTSTSVSSFLLPPSFDLKIFFSPCLMRLSLCLQAKLGHNQWNPVFALRGMYEVSMLQTHLYIQEVKWKPWRRERCA